MTRTGYKPVAALGRGGCPLAVPFSIPPLITVFLYLADQGEYRFNPLFRLHLVTVQRLDKKFTAIIPYVYGLLRVREQHVAGVYFPIPAQLPAAVNHTGFKVKLIP